MKCWFDSTPRSFSIQDTILNCWSIARLRSAISSSRRKTKNDPWLVMANAIWNKTPLISIFYQNYTDEELNLAFEIYDFANRCYHDWPNTVTSNGIARPISCGERSAKYFSFSYLVVFEVIGRRRYAKQVHFRNNARAMFVVVTHEWFYDWPTDSHLAWGK